MRKNKTLNQLNKKELIENMIMVWDEYAAITEELAELIEVAKKSRSKKALNEIRKDYIALVPVSN